MAQFLKLPTKKDFGLGKHRVTLPETENGSDSDHTNSEPSTPDAKNKVNSSSPLHKRISIMTGKVKNLFNKSDNKAAGSPLLRSSPGVKDKVTHDQDLMNFDNNGRSSPVLHSRVVKKDLFASDGVKGSLDNLKDQYSLLDNDDDHSLPLGSQDGILKLLLQSGNKDQQITIRRNPEGLGIRVSSGQPPVIITRVEPDSDAMVAGLKVNDVILEVNSKDCRNLESIEISRLLQLKSLIKKSPNLEAGRGMKVSLTISSIDDDIEDSDEDDSVFRTPLRDQDSIDEQMFEYSPADKDKFQPMPSFQEEKQASKEKEKSQNNELLIDLSLKDSTTSTINSSGNNNNICERTDSEASAIDKPVPSIRRSKTDNTLDFKTIPTTEKLGGDVGRYKIAIGKARKRKLTRRPSSVIVKREFDLFSDQSMDSNEDKSKKTRSFSSSSTTSEKGDKPLVKQKPPVALRRKSSSKEDELLIKPNPLHTPTTQQPEVARRRYTIGPPPGQGNNTQMLAQAASTRAKLRSSFKRNSDTENSVKEEIMPKEKEDNSQKKEPEWITLAKKKKENMTPSSSNASLVEKETVNDKPQSSVLPQTSTEKHMTTAPMTTAPKLIKDIPTIIEEKSSKPVVPPPKPSRLRERLSSASEQDKNTTNKNVSYEKQTPTVKVTSDVDNVVDTKPVPTPRKVSKTDKISEDEPKKSLETIPSKIEPSSDDKSLPKLVPTPRKNSFKNVTDVTQTSVVTETPTVNIKPIINVKQPSIANKEPKNEINKTTEDSKIVMDTCNSKAKETVKPKPPGNVRSKLAMFEQT